MAVRLKYGHLAPEGLARMKALEHYLNADAGMDRIIHEHLLEGRVVEDLDDASGEGKQRVRERAPALKSETV